MEKEYGPNEDSAFLLGQLRQSDSKFGHSLRDKPAKYADLTQKVESLTDFYQHIKEYPNALSHFQNKFTDFCQHPDSKTGFLGELEVANCLRHCSIPHQFVKETNVPTQT